MDSWEEIGLIIELLRMQTIPPFITLVDTGSEPENYLKIEKYRAPDIEVHRLALNGVLHPCDLPAWAMDLAMSICRSEFLFTTHQDLFLRKRDVIQELIPLCAKHKAVGYAMTLKRYHETKGMIGHQCSMFHVPTMDVNYCHWNQRKMCRLFGLPDQRPDGRRQWWPDTELPINYMLREAEIKPYIIGQETFSERQVDRRLDHCRAVNTYRLYHPQYLQKALGWIKQAKSEAQERIEQWRSQPPPKPALSVITAVSRPQNLPALDESLNALRNHVDLEWICVADSSKVSVDDIQVDCVKLEASIPESVAGAYQKQVGLDNATGDWIWFLDDDNLCHPNFGLVLSHYLKQWPEENLFVFDQVWKDDRTVRCFARIECFQRMYVDQAQYVFRRSAAEKAKFIMDYQHDWYFLESLALNPVFCRNEVTYYNALVPR